MNRDGLAGLRDGEVLGPLRFEVSAEANDRYWRAAGIDHPARAAGRLFPPMAANLTILLLQSRVDEPVLHTAQRLICRRGAGAGVELTVTGRVAEHYQRRGRAYVVVDASVVLPDGDELWISRSTFTPVAS